MLSHALLLLCPNALAVTSDPGAGVSLPEVGLTLPLPSGWQLTDQKPASLVMTDCLVRLGIQPPTRETGAPAD